jgi:hypothetical protein
MPIGPRIDPLPPLRTQFHVARIPAVHLHGSRCRETSVILWEWRNLGVVLPNTGGAGPAGISTYRAVMKPKRSRPNSRRGPVAWACGCCAGSATRGRFRSSTRLRTSRATGRFPGRRRPRRMCDAAVLRQSERCPGSLARCKCPGTRHSPGRRGRQLGIITRPGSSFAKLQSPSRTRSSPRSPGTPPESILESADSGPVRRHFPWHRLRTESVVRPARYGA